MGKPERREADDEMLRDLLRGQREAVLAVVAGLDEADWHRSVVPTGWTPAGLVEHLGGAEWHWFQGVVAGIQPELPGDLTEDQPPYDPLTVVFTTDDPSTEVIAFTATSARSPRRCLTQPPSRLRHWASTGLATRATECSLGRLAHDRGDRRGTPGIWTSRGSCSMARPGWVAADGLLPPSLRSGL